MPAETLTLTRDAFPMLLLTAATHPDEAFRNSLWQRIDQGIDAFSPWHSLADVRAVLSGLRFQTDDALADEPAALEVACRVVRAAFSRNCGQQTQRLMLIGACKSRRKRCLNSSLELVPKPDNRNGQILSYFSAKLFLHDAGQQYPLASGKWAECRVSNGYELHLLDRTPKMWWKPSQKYMVNVLAEHSLKPAGRLELQVEASASSVILRPTVPETIIRFSTALARSQVLSVEIDHAHTIRVYVRLQDFDGDVVSLRRVDVSRRPVIRWMWRQFGIQVPLSLDELHAILCHLTGGSFIPRGCPEPNEVLRRFLYPEPAAALASR